MSSSQEIEHFEFPSQEQIVLADIDNILGQIDSTHSSSHEKMKINAASNFLIVIRINCIIIINNYNN